jgi:hypothetical protein
MEMHPINEVDAKVSVIRDSRSALRRMTPEQLLHLGMNQVVYLKSGICDGKALVALYGADGNPIAVTDDADAAVETAAKHGLSFVPVH